MNHDRLLVRVIVENNNLQQPPSSIRADDEIPSFAGNHPQRIPDGMLDVFVANPVLSRAVRDLHRDKVALSRRIVKATLSSRVLQADPGAAGPGTTP